ncbi:methyltransferase [Spirosoma gilvum]
MYFDKKIKKLISKWVWIPYTKFYLSKDHQVKIGEIKINIPVGVFHPTLFFSTEFLLNHINTLTIEYFRALELGAGSGLLAVAMAKRNAFVTASDISLKACEAVQQNAKLNEVTIEVIHSDLFDDITYTPFDLIVINPPYYPQDAQSEAELAWYCGKNFDYFQKLFSQLSSFLSKDGRAIMVLSEDCHIDKISQLAIQSNLNWEKTVAQKIKGEWNYIFTITSSR